MALSVKSKLPLSVKRQMFITVGVIVAACLIAAAIIYLVPSLRRGVRTEFTEASARLSKPATEVFPSVNRSKLSPLQSKLVSLVRSEYIKHPISYDKDVMKYTQGNSEAWCADFLSWLMLQAGVPYRNPNSGGWRIPGVFTLQQYYQSQHRYKPAGSYIPKPGDIAFVHFGSHDIIGHLSGHAELIIESDNDSMTTIGGNENGRMRIDTQKITAGTNGLVGFGQL